MYIYNCVSFLSVKYLVYVHLCHKFIHTKKESVNKDNQYTFYYLYTYLQFINEHVKLNEQLAETLTCQRTLSSPTKLFFCILKYPQNCLCFLCLASVKIVMGLSILRNCLKNSFF